MTHAANGKGRDMKVCWTREDDAAVEKAAGERLEEWFRKKGIKFEKVEDRER